MREVCQAWLDGFYAPTGSQERYWLERRSRELGLLKSSSTN